MTPHELLERLVQLMPEFEQQWNSDRNYHRDDDGSFTLHGVCSEFSSFFRDHHARFSDSALTELFEFVEWNVVEPDADETPVDNAICTCFLENISSEPCGEAAKKFMGRRSLAFFSHWHSGPPY